MAVALRCLARATRFSVVKRTTDSLSVAPAFLSIKKFIQTKPYDDPSKEMVTEIDLSTLPEFEVTKNPEEWQYVERLFAPLVVPPLNKNLEGPLPSGFVPPRAEGRKHPYFVPRNKSHMLPVYLQLSFRGSRHITMIKNIQGDIWKMEEELRKYLEEKLTSKHTSHIAFRVNEMACWIKFRGDHVSYVKLWMESKGF